MNQDKNGNNKLTSFIKGSSVLVISNVCLKAINFFLLPLYTSNLTPAMIGISDSITTLTGILLPLLTMGLDSAFSAFYFDKDDPNRPKVVFSTLVFTFALLGLVPLLLMVLAPEISLLLFKTKQYSYIVMFAMVSVTFNLWFLPYSLELRLKNKMFLFGLANIVASLTMVILNILFVSVLHLGESSLVLSTMIVHVEELLVLLLFNKTKISRGFFDKKLLKDMVRFAIPLIPMTLMMWVLSLSDRYVLLHFHGNEAVGLYGIGLRFTNLLNVVVSAVSVAYTTFAFSSKDDEGSKKRYYAIFNVESFFLIICSFTVGLFAKEIIQIMTSEAYSTAYMPICDLLFSQTFFAMTSIVGYGIFFNKKSIYSLIAVTVGAVVNLILNLLFIPEYGINAAAFTTLVGYGLNFFITLYFSEKLYPCDYGQIRVLLMFAVLYFICKSCLNLVILVKIIIWVVCLACVLYIYKSLLKRLIMFMLNMVFKN